MVTTHNLTTLHATPPTGPAPTPSPIAEELVSHLEGQGVQFYQFSFRWMNCLLMREMPLQLIIRVWDTCIAEKDG